MGLFSKVIQKARGKRAPLQALHVQGGVLRRKVAEGKWVPVKKQVEKVEKKKDEAAKRAHRDYRGGHTAPDYNYGAALHEAEPKFFPGIFEHPRSYDASDFTRGIMKRTQNEPDKKVRVFRAVPDHVDEIHEGDWVALNPKYAQKHGTKTNNPKVISREVLARDLYTDGDAEEWGWAPRHSKSEKVEKGRGLGSKQAELGEERERGDGYIHKKTLQGWVRVRKIGGEKPKPEEEEKKRGRGKAKPGPTKKLEPGHQLPKKVLAALKKAGISKLPGVEVPKKDIIGFQTDNSMECMVKFKDASGKVQYGYSAAKILKGQQEKFRRVVTLAPKMGKSIEDMMSYITKPDRFGTPPPEPGDKEHRGTMIALTVALTGMRPGSVDSSNFGASTLQPDHIEIDGDTATFTFIGKNNKENKYTIQNKAYVENLKPYLKGKKAVGLKPPVKGEKSPALKDRNDLNFVFDAATSGLESAQAAGKEYGGFKLKDYRTVIATNKGRDVLKQYAGPPPPLTGDVEKDKVLLCKAMIDASKAVAEVIQNTANVSKKSYIHPHVFKEFMQERCNAPDDLINAVFEQEKVTDVDKVIDV